MTIWLINAYGPIPGEGWRDYRYTIIGETLAAGGHEVIWWTSSFSHHFKVFRSRQWEDRVAGDSFRIRLVPGSGYKRNISLARVWNEFTFAWRVYMRARRGPRPDLIIVAEPPATIGRMAIWVAHRWKCPLIFDVADLWPELFALALPKVLRRWTRLIFFPLFEMRRRNHDRADGLLAVCESYRASMMAQTSRRRHIPSATIFIGIDITGFRSSMKNPLEGVDLPAKAENVVRAVYAGSLGENYDIKTLMKAAEILEQSAVPVQIVVAGVGPMVSPLKKFIRERRLKSLAYVGSLTPEQLPSLYGRCDIGISAYGPASTVGMPVKVYDYMAAGLPIVNSLKGEIAEFIETHQIGVSYMPGDPESLAAALQRLALDRQFRSKMAQQSFETGNEFDLHVQYGILPELVESIRNANGNTSRASIVRL